MGIKNKNKYLWHNHFFRMRNGYNNTATISHLNIIRYSYDSIFIIRVGGSAFFIIFKYYILIVYIKNAVIRTVSYDVNAFVAIR